MVSKNVASKLAKEGVALYVSVIFPRATEKQLVALVVSKWRHQHISQDKEQNDSIKDVVRQLSAWKRR